MIRNAASSDSPLPNHSGADPTPPKLPPPSTTRDNSTPLSTSARCSTARFYERRARFLSCSHVHRRRRLHRRPHTGRATRCMFASAPASRSSTARSPCASPRIARRSGSSSASGRTARTTGRTWTCAACAWTACACADGCRRRRRWSCRTASHETRPRRSGSRGACASRGARTGSGGGRQGFGSARSSRSFRGTRNVDGSSTPPRGSSGKARHRRPPTSTSVFGHRPATPRSSRGRPRRRAGGTRAPSATSPLHSAASGRPSERCTCRTPSRCAWRPLRTHRFRGTSSPSRRIRCARSRAATARYPWKTYTLVVSPDLHDVGIEYPTLVFIGGSDFITTIVQHETAHQWFYSLVGNDQERDPWLDEALATWAQVHLRSGFPGAPVTGARPRHVGSPMSFFAGRQSDYFREVYGGGLQALTSLRAPRRVDCALRRYAAREAYAIAQPSNLLDELDRVLPGASSRLRRYGIR